MAPKLTVFPSPWLLIEEQTCLVLPQIISEHNNSAIGLFVFCTLLKYPLVNTYGLRLIKPSLLPVKQTFLQSKRESSCSSQEILPRELRTIFRYHAKYVILTLMLSCKPSSSTKIFVVVQTFQKIKGTKIRRNYRICAAYDSFLW